MDSESGREPVEIPVGRIINALVEYAVLMEILWPVIFPGHTFHEAFLNGARDLTNRARDRIAIWHTLNMIRTLPEAQRKRRK